MPVSGKKCNNNYYYIIMIYLSKIKIIGMITISIGFVLDISTKTAYSLCAKERFLGSDIRI
jgi:hypothetical protein